MTNATFVDAKGQRHFLSGFEYADFILNSQLKTGLSRFPLNLVLEYENNLKAASHPLDSKGNVITSIGSQNQAYLGEISIGQVKNRNDLQFGYGFWRSGQDSILATFSESEQRAATNIIEHHIFASWRLQVECCGCIQRLDRAHAELQPAARRIGTRGYSPARRSHFSRVTSLT